MSDSPQHGKPSRISVHSVPIKDPLSHELAQTSGISPEQARKVLLDAIHSISDADLKHLRGGQVLIIR